MEDMDLESKRSFKSYASAEYQGDSADMPADAEPPTYLRPKH